MAVSFIASAVNFATGSGTSLACSSSLNVAAGDTLVCFVAWEDGAAGTIAVTDGGSNSFTLNAPTDNGGGYESCGYLLSASANASATFTFTNSTTAPYRSVMVLQFRKDAGDTAALDPAASNPASSTGSVASVVTAALTTSGDDTLVACGIKIYSASGFVSHQIDSVNATAVTNSSWNNAWYRILSAGMTGGTGTVTVNAAAWVSQIIAISFTAEGGPSNTPSSTPSATPSSTPSNTPSPSATPSSTPSATGSATPSSTPSSTPSPSATPSGTPSPTPSGTPSNSPSGTTVTTSLYANPTLSGVQFDITTTSAIVSGDCTLLLSADFSFDFQDLGGNVYRIIVYTETLSTFIDLFMEVAAEITSIDNVIGWDIDGDPVYITSVTTEDYPRYSRGPYGALPGDDADLSTLYSAADYIAVAADDGSRVGVTGSDYVLHEFKDAIGSVTSIHLHWNGQSDLAPSSSAVRLQIYNRNTASWETVDTDNASNADTDFDLEYTVLDTTNYADADGIVCCRVYQ